LIQFDTATLGINYSDSVQGVNRVDRGKPI
jgi:hypothetical protein